MGLTKDQILNVQDLSMEEIEIKEWNGSIFIRGLTSEERDQFESLFLDDQGDRKKAGSILSNNIRAKLVSLCLCDSNGERLFNDAEVKALAKKSGLVINRLFLIAQKLSSIGAEDLGDLRKNSESGQAEDSPSV